MIALILEGPTGVGKSEVAMALAERLHGEIVSADSRQVYRKLDIGTAKPSREEQQRVPHHLIDVIEPEETYSAGRFAREAISVIEDIVARGRVPLIVGGTGFYVKALRDGLFPVIEVPEEIRVRLRELADRDPVALFRRLAESDPAALTRLHPNDTQRIIRALEVFEATGTPMSEHWKQDTAKCGIEAISVFFDRERETLYQRLNSRCDMMINHGLLDEIQGLLEMGLNFDTPGLNTVGYHEFQPFFQETTTLGECLSLMKQHTRNYAKRQWTWYRKCDFDLTYQLDTTTISEVVDDIIAHW